MMDAGRHPRIEILRRSELVSLEGEPGAFRATIRRHPTGVDEALCTACGACSEVCNFEAPSPFDAGMGTHKAISRPFPQSVPAVYAIDFDLCKKCKLCVKACPRDAIDLDMEPVDELLDVGAVILATGFDEFDPHRMRNYGFGTYPNVLTSLQFERLLNASGPTLGHVRRPSDTKAPRRLVYVQCVGARGEAGRFNCSRYCCMNAVKNAILAKQHDPNVESVTILYTDMRAFGKGSDDLYERARGMDWIHFLRGRPSKIDEDPQSHNLEILVEDTESGKPQRIPAEMVILSCAGTASSGAAELAGRVGIEVSEMGFFARLPGESPVLTRREGIFVAGSAGGPQIIPDCVAQGSAAAAMAAAAVGTDSRLPEPATQAALPSPESALPQDTPDGVTDVTAEAPMVPEPRIGIFLCHCGINIAGVLDMKQLLAEARVLPGVVHATEELFACSITSQEAIQEAIRHHQLNRVVIAACTPRTHEPIFRQNCEAAGLNAYLLEMVNIRDQCSWVHADEPALATRKAGDLLRMATTRARRLEPLERVEVGVTPRALVVGGGLPGMQAAIDLRALGLDVILIERSRELGGLVGKLHRLFPDGRGSGEAIQSLVQRLRESGADVRLGTEVRDVEGFVGNFRVRLGAVAAQAAADEAAADADSDGDGDGDGDAEQIEIGAIVIAIGGEAYEPDENEFGYGRFANVITSLELEQRLADPAKGLAGVRSIAFIQCVGSRRSPPADGEKPGYPGCSRICCPATIKQSLELRKQGIETIVFYRDMRTVGLGAEEAYRDSRGAGTLFIRFHENNPPRIQGAGTRAQSVVAYDSLLRKQVIAPVDLIVLGVGLVPRAQEMQRIQEMLKTPRGSDGFFLELHPELGPVETCVDGVVLCGVTQGPKDIPDSFAQASAAAAKVAVLLGRRSLYLEPTVCHVDPALCRGCGLCVSLCEFHAPALVETETGILLAEINPARCKGCGTCAAWCPTGAIGARHFTDDQITAMIDSLFLTGAER
jgi:heterodisulfide reductase subunit A